MENKFKEVIVKKTKGRTNFKNPGHVEQVMAELKNAQPDLVVQPGTQFVEIVLSNTQEEEPEIEPQFFELSDTDPYPKIEITPVDEEYVQLRLITDPEEDEESELGDTEEYVNIGVQPQEPEYVVVDLTNTDDNEDLEVSEPPKRKRGRPKGSTNKPKQDPKVPKTTPAKPKTTPSGKKRGWPKGKPRNRTKALSLLTFKNVMSRVQSIKLPTNDWSVQILIEPDNNGQPKNRIYFSRVDSKFPTIKCRSLILEDSTLEETGILNYTVQMDNIDVEMLACPPTIDTIRDLESLLESVNNLDSEDQGLEYRHFSSDFSEENNPDPDDNAGASTSSN